jgi:hypothetical protein
MAQNITLWGATYSNVPACLLPKSGGGTARFTDVTPTTATDSDVASGKIYFKSDGTQSTGTSSGGGSSKNVQVAAGVDRVATTSYTAVNGQTLTVAKTGTYNVYWTGYRSSTSGTSGSQLYIGNTAYGSAHTTFSNHAQAVHLTNVSLTQNQTITVRARARSTSYFMYVGNLTIVEQ